MPARVARTVEMREKQAAGEAKFITRQIDGGDLIAMGQQRFQLLQTGRFAEGTAHNANQIRLYVKRLTAFAHACDNRFHHAVDGQIVGHRHIAWGKTQFDIMQAIARRIFNIFERHATAGI
ncbi:hypothetical protein D3C81_1799080 [compost metagenome]